MAARRAGLLAALLPCAAALTTRRGVLGGGGAAALIRGSGGGGGSRVWRCAQPVGYYETALALDCGVRVPAAVWLPGELAAAETSKPANYDYRISVGKLFRTFLGFPLPNSVAWSFRLAASEGVYAAAPPPASAALASTPAVVLAHGFLGSRFDLSLYGEALTAKGAVVVSPDFDQSLTGSYVSDPDGGSDRDAIVAAAVAHARRDLGAGGKLGALGHSMGAGTSMRLSGAAARVAIAGFVAPVGDAPFLAIASSGDGPVPLSRVRPTVDGVGGVEPVDAAVSAPYPKRAALFLTGDDAPTHVSYLSPPVNDAMQAFLGPLLPVARALNVPVLDFDRYGLVRDADATSRRVVPVATGFLAQHLGLEE